MKRFSVFVSSTLKDTKDARASVIGGLLSTQYIPCCMEFPFAALADTKTHIESQIEISDFVCLILKNEYGQIASGMDVSWTEFEYDVAARLGKPVIGCVFSPKRATPASADPRTTELAQRIEADNRTLIFWTSPAQLSAAVLGSLKALTQGNPGGGWVRRDRDRDEEESLESFYRRSADYNFAPFILYDGDLRILLNDGYNWSKRHKQSLEIRFRNLAHRQTTFITSDDVGRTLPYLAMKSLKTESEQRNDIIEFHAAMRELAADCGYDKLTLLKSDLLNTHCLYLCDQYALVTTYFTSPHRFLHLPLFKYRSGTSLFDDYSEDFNLIARPLLNRTR